MTNSSKNPQSLLVQAVLTLDNHFSELTRLGGRIEDQPLKTESDLEQAQKIMNLFADSAQGVADGVVALSNALNESRIQAEAIASQVAARAEILHARQDEQQKKLEAFRLLGEKVTTLNASLIGLKPAAGKEVLDEDRAVISKRLAELDVQLLPLIEEADFITKDAKNTNMTQLEQNAHSLKQSLSSLSQKLGSLQQSH